MIRSRVVVNTLDRIIRKHQKQAFVGAVSMDAQLVKLWAALQLTQELATMTNATAIDNAYTDTSTISRSMDVVGRAIQGIRPLLSSTLKVEADKLKAKLMQLAQR